MMVKLKLVDSFRNPTYLKRCLIFSYLSVFHVHLFHVHKGVYCMPKQRSKPKNMCHRNSLIWLPI